MIDISKEMEECEGIREAEHEKILVENRFHCPLCDALKEIDELTEENRNLAREVGSLEDEIADLES